MKSGKFLLLTVALVALLVALVGCAGPGEAGLGAETPGTDLSTPSIDETPGLGTDVTPDTGLATPDTGLGTGGTATDTVPSETPSVDVTPTTEMTGTTGTTEWESTQFLGFLNFSYPAGWTVEGEAGEMPALTGPYEGTDFRIEIERADPGSATSFDEWLTTELESAGMTSADAESVTMGQVEASVARNVQDDEYQCPVARIFIWADAQAAGQQGVIITISQDEGAGAGTSGLGSGTGVTGTTEMTGTTGTDTTSQVTCDSAALDAFVDDLLEQLQQS